ncbi:50S ribosomal protein L4 [Paenibacillus thiaminolyticus]|jgi:large subunit ribosomal protein L4|uniref:Large ribosomal subunit protein uL4 n=3 Tax=Paenibacillus TaxID=44249 RepID=H3SEM1_9BACL|nr:MULTISPECIES: 50S ribosomal protein L4 [Paenibacillus]MEB9894206.1 50S ribosomal protein L4 [Bacillus cereus]EHQ62469.1 50S ribosomal protein L4 [Paenibacillus dendritiformis C454]MBG9791263.1 50S ribosomal protein L4 [Paenibacillus dendritiformis]MCY9537526.1 50S ribosomal protein L4 [Paenibacillus thiaminolyticus]MCY9604777.1 50S ribosomal protein L4 [Paenibacillus thiaminolyticus]
MPKVAVYNISGAQVGEIELADTVFGIEPNKHVLHDAVVMQLASMRQGTHKVKTRSEVSGGGRKPWKQKGTGRARQGSIRSPQWKGGGTVFGPTPRSYAYKLPKKVRRLAIKSALSSKVLAEQIIVLDQLTMNAPKTKEFAAILNNLKVDRKALVVVPEYNDNVALSARNIPSVKLVAADGVNVYDVLRHEKLIITKDAVQKVEEVFA